MIEIDVLHRFIDQIDVPVLRSIGRNRRQAQLRKPDSSPLRSREAIPVVSRVGIDEEEPLFRRRLQRLSLSHRLDQCHRCYLHFGVTLGISLLHGYRVPTGRKSGSSTSCPCGSTAGCDSTASFFAASRASSLCWRSITGATPTSSGGIGDPMTPQAADDKTTNAISMAFTITSVPVAECAVRPVLWPCRQSGPCDRSPPERSTARTRPCQSGRRTDAAPRA